MLWISVDDELPGGDSNWDEYIVTFEGYVFVGRWYPVPQKWYSGSCYPYNDITGKVTHWMDFPEPPEEVGCEV